LYSPLHSGHGIFVLTAWITSHSALETTAAEAQVEAPTGKIAREVEKNAEQERTVAEQAAAAAEVSRFQPQKPLDSYINLKKFN
jgi:cell division protein FtsB